VVADSRQEEEMAAVSAGANAGQVVAVTVVKVPDKVALDKAALDKAGAVGEKVGLEVATAVGKETAGLAQAAAWEWAAAWPWGAVCLQVVERVERRERLNGLPT
jgi:hypothetical protein